MIDGDDAEPGSMGTVLACEVCWTEFRPERFGRASVADVPHDARCLRCGGVLVETDPEGDD